MKTDGNHPAFESAVYHTKYSDSADRFPGLTKREYFAAMAMQGVLANPRMTNFQSGRSIVNAVMARAATEARIAADALIAALNEGQ